MNEAMAEQLALIIKQFVKENYGDNEADNPSWDIDALSLYIVNFLDNVKE